MICHTEETATIVATLSDAMPDDGNVQWEQKFNDEQWKELQTTVSQYMLSSTNAPGTYTFRARVHGASTWKTIENPVSIINVDLDIDADYDGDIDKDDEEKEESAGGLVVVNHDDDNQNSTPDKDESGTVTGEDDLIPIKIAIQPQLEDGTLTLEAISGNDKIKIWEEETKTKECPGTWTIGQDDIKETYYIEGIEASTSMRDVELRLQYTKNNENIDDKVKLTVIKIDLLAYDLDGVVEDKDESNKGAFIHWNIDNDDASNNSLGTPKRPGADYLQTDKEKIEGEDDLKKIIMDITSNMLNGKVTLCINNSKSMIWKDAAKGSDNLILRGGETKMWDFSNVSQRNEFYAYSSHLYVEGVEESTCHITLKYEMTEKYKVNEDIIKYTFIAADCGNQPTTTGQRARLEDWFPKLKRCEWSITGDPTPIYNCIAWSVGISDIWFQDKIVIDGIPISEIYYEGVHIIGIDAMYGNSNGLFSIEEDMDPFYATVGGVTPNANNWKDAKIIYYDGYHGAKKKSCTCGSEKWIMYESKCGRGEKIEHVYDQLDESTVGYGNRIRYYK